MHFDFYTAVSDFHNKFRAVSNWRDFDESTWELRKNLVVEEAREFAEAMDSGDIDAAIKEACDVLYVTFGFFVSLGIRPDVFFREVQYANMSKVDKNGNPIIREDGKILKEGTSYFKPSVGRLVPAPLREFVNSGFRQSVLTRMGLGKRT